MKLLMELGTKAYNNGDLRSNIPEQFRVESILRSIQLRQNSKSATLNKAKTKILDFETRVFMSQQVNEL